MVTTPLMISFSDYEENYKKRVGDVVPKRLKYRKLVRG